MFHSTCEIYAHIYELKRLKGEENADRPFIPDQSAILIRRLLLKPIRALFLSLSLSLSLLSSISPLFLLPPSPLLSSCLSLSLSRIIFLVCCPSSPPPLLSQADLTSCHFSALKFLWCVQFPT